MDIGRTYATKIVDRDNEFGLQIESIPALWMPDDWSNASRTPFEQIQFATELLGLELSWRGESESGFLSAIRVTLQVGIAHPDLLHDWPTEGGAAQEVLSDTPDIAAPVINFVDYALTSDLILAELSPPNIVSIAKMAVTGGVGLGVAVAAGLPWIALITVPAGILVVKPAEAAASGIGIHIGALLDPLRAKLRQYAKLHEDGYITDADLEKYRERLLEEDLSRYNQRHD